MLQRDLAVVLGLLMFIGILSLNLVVSDPRAIPLTTALLAPLIVSATAGPRLVAALGVASVGLGFALGLDDDLPATELYTRLGLVAVASALSVGVAAARTSRERALERASRVEELSTALQAGLIPTLTSGPRVQVVSAYQPGVHDLLLGGDFLDVIALPDGATAFCLGDVAGHTPDAAAIGTALRTTWRALALMSPSTVSWVEGLDRLLSFEAGEGELFATLLVGLVDAEGTSVQITTAGHHSPFLRAPSTTELTLPDAPPLGLGLDLGGWTCVRRELTTPWELVCYTDGLIEGREAPGAPARYGAERIAAQLAGRPEPLNESAVRALIADAVRANGEDLEDDVAVLVLRVTPSTTH